MLVPDFLNSIYVLNVYIDICFLLSFVDHFAFLALHYHVKVMVYFNGFIHCVYLIWRLGNRLL